MKKTPNIDAVMQMTKEYLDGEMSLIDYKLDFPYEVTQRFQKMRREDPDYAEMIYFHLVEHGVDSAAALSNDDFYDLIEERYQTILENINCDLF